MNAQPQPLLETGEVAVREPQRTRSKDAPPGLFGKDNDRDQDTNRRRRANRRAQRISDRKHRHGQTPTPDGRLHGCHPCATAEPSRCSQIATRTFKERAMFTNYAVTAACVAAKHEDMSRARR